jgi:hypothetical protein
MPYRTITINYLENHFKVNQLVQEYQEIIAISPKEIYLLNSSKVQECAASFEFLIIILRWPAAWYDEADVSLTLLCLDLSRNDICLKDSIYFMPR